MIKIVSVSKNYVCFAKMSSGICKVLSLFRDFFFLLKYEKFTILCIVIFDLFNLKKKWIIIGHVFKSEKKLEHLINLSAYLSMQVFSNN